MGERWLIVTADDLGMSVAINEAIRDAARAGIVTAAGILANGGALESARDAALDATDLGVHLNLTEGLPLLPVSEVTSLVGRDGSFHSLPNLVFRASLGLVRADQVVRECEAQIDRMRRLGFPISYADSHQHIHAHPRLAIAIAQAVRRAGLTRIRQAIDWSRGPDVIKARVIAATMRANTARFDGFTRCDATRGIARRPTSIEEWERILVSLPRGRTELIVHLRRPGLPQPGEERVRDAAARQAEWRTLMDPRARDALARHGVRLVRPTGNVGAPADVDLNTGEEG